LGEPGFSLFGLASPAFAALDGFLAPTVAPLIRVVLWGALMSVVTMLLYRLLSPQEKLARLRAETGESRRKLAEFDGELEGLWPLVGESLALSLRQIGTIFVPALIASLPVVSCLVWLDSEFGYRAPAPGDTLAVQVSPATEPLYAQPAALLTGGPTDRQLTWPASGEQVALLDRTASSLAELGDPPGSHVIEHRRWWNALIGNPMGYLPARSPIERLELGLQPLELHGVGPGWLRGWPIIFFTTLITLSILIKVLFRIE